MIAVLRLEQVQNAEDVQEDTTINFYYTIFSVVARTIMDDI